MTEMPGTAANLYCHHQPGQIKGVPRGRGGGGICQLSHCQEWLESQIPVEDGDTFEANARIKAEHYSLAAPGELVLAEDSGLAVDALGGAPGVYSARYAAQLAGGHDASTHQNSDDAANNAALIKQLERLPHSKDGRSGKYVCVIAIARDGKTIQTFRGEVAGTMLTATPRNWRFWL